MLLCYPMGSRPGGSQAWHPEHRAALRGMTGARPLAGRSALKKTREGLLGLKGVNYAASMILDILDSAVWPVIDRRAILAVFGTRPDHREWRRGQWSCAAVH